MAVKYEIKEYLNFGRCVCIDNGKMEMYVTIDVGPRIIKLNLKGKENMMFTDTERLSSNDCNALKDMFGQDKAWYIYGGHRFWVSPESLPETYYPDNDPVDYKIDGNVFTFTAPVQIYTKWQEIIEITVDEDNAAAKVRHILKNCADKEQTGSIWAMSVTAAGSKAVIAQASEDTGLLANRTLMLWPYNHMTDKRFYMDDKYISLSQDTNASTAFKFGSNNTNGVHLCVNNETVFKKFSKYVEGANYPDNGCSTEIYTNHFMLEVESLSPLYTLKPGESCEHVENWELYEENSTKLEDIVKYL